jgi:hypothetical protein
MFPDTPDLTPATDAWAVNTGEGKLNEWIEPEYQRRDGRRDTKKVPAARARDR